MLVIAVCGGSLTARPLQTHAAEPWRPPLKAAAALIAALPQGLTLPSVPPSWQIVSMIADDIDADGDLDVVTNDGSLNLVVWINDGTGRLSRHDNRDAADRAQTLSGAAVSARTTESQAVSPVPSSGLPETAATASLPLPAPRAHWSAGADPLLARATSSRSPRGPPPPVVVS